MTPLTKLESQTILLTSCYVAGVLYDDIFTYLAYALLLDMGLSFTVLWLKNWFGGDP